MFQKALPFFCNSFNLILLIANLTLQATSRRALGSPSGDDCMKQRLIADMGCAFFSQAPPSVISQCGQNLICSGAADLAELMLTAVMIRGTKSARIHIFLVGQYDTSRIMVSNRYQYQRCVILSDCSANRYQYPPRIILSD